MKNRQNDQISESGSSEDEGPPDRSSSKAQISSSSENSSDESSAEPEHSQRKPTLSLNTSRSSISPNKTFSDEDPLSRFTSQNPELVAIKLKDVIGKDDEICILQCPKSVNAEDFLGKKINFDKKSKIKINKMKYVIQPSEEESEPLAILGKHLRIITPLATLKLQYYFKELEKSEVSPGIEYGKILLPDNIKTRHPLFGSEYLKKIELSKEVESKLNEAIDNLAKKKKKKKKHKQEEPIFDILTSKANVKINEEPREEPIFSMLEHSSEKKKKSKHETNLINSTAIHDLQLPNFDLDFSCISKEEGRKKKKKSSISKSEPEVSEEVVSTDKLQIKKELLEESDQSPKRRKKHKSETKIEKEDESSSLIANILNNVKSELNNSAKRKKKKLNVSE